MKEKNIIAIGRSRYLYDTIVHLLKKDFVFKAIVTDTAYEEYEVKHHDFELLANKCKAKFFMLRSVNHEELIHLVKENGVRVAISANWRYTIPQSFLDLFECGILNFHLGNLPDYKGNATINWSILNDESHINGNIHKMEMLIDCGDILASKQIPITNETYARDIIIQAEKDAPLLYERALNNILENPAYYESKNDAHGLRCYPRLPEDGQIDWKEAAEYICRLVRASAEPYPGAYTYLDKKKVIIWRAKVWVSSHSFLAIPGHILSIKDESIVVACKNSMLEVQEIEVDGRRIRPSTFIKSTRLRFRFH